MGQAMDCSHSASLSDGLLAVRNSFLRLGDFFSWRHTTLRLVALL